MVVIYDILEILSYLFRFVGMLAFGLGAGWFTLHAFKDANWQLKIAIYLGFVGTGIGMANFLSAGALGAFGLGAGAAMLMWGLNKGKKEKEADED